MCLQHQVTPGGANLASGRHRPTDCPTTTVHETSTKGRLARQTPKPTLGVPQRKFAAPWRRQCDCKCIKGWRDAADEVLLLNVRLCEYGREQPRRGIVTRRKMLEVISRQALTLDCEQTVCKCVRWRRLRELVTLDRQRLLGYSLSEAAKWNFSRRCKTASAYTCHT